MHPVGRQALEKLLSSAEGAQARGGKARGLIFLGKGFPQYQVDTVDVLNEIHATLAAAERAGAITITWSRRSGDRGQVERIDLVDADRLAQHLGLVPHWRQVETARTLLVPWLGKWTVDWLLAQWAERKAPRERGPDAAAQFVEALRTLDALASGDDKVSMRRLSAKLFGDSKRIESRTVELDLLTRSDDGPARSDQELFGELGLLYYPQPFLMAAEGGFALLNGGARQSLLKPYVGVDPDVIVGMVLQGRYVLSVENLTTFHELARGPQPIQGLLLYTAGTPGPAWLRAYRAVLASTDVPILHWGDTDVGGVRVLARLSSVARLSGKAVRPWRMGTQSERSRRALTDREVDYIERICLDNGWDELAHAVRAARAAIEQESQNLSLPQ